MVEHVIQTNAGRIDVCGTGPGANEFCQAGAKIRSVRLREGIQDLLKWHRCCGAKRVVRNVGDICGLRLLQTQPFVGEEEKRSVLTLIDTGNLYRAAERTAEIVLPFGGHRAPKIVVKPVIRVKVIVANVIETTTVPLVRAGAGHKRELSSRAASEFGRIRGTLDTELFQRIDGHEPLRRAKCSRGGERSRRSGRIGEPWSDAHIGAHTIDDVVVLLRPLPVHTEFPGEAGARSELRVVADDTRSKQNQVLKAAPVEWHVRDVVLIDDCA